VSDWIKVTERAPKRDRAVIGYDRFYNRVGEAFNTGRKDDYGEPRLVFVDSDDCHITHWQPMPDEPKEGG